MKRHIFSVLALSTLCSCGVIQDRVAIELGNLKTSINEEVDARTRLAAEAAVKKGDFQTAMDKADELRIASNRASVYFVIAICKGIHKETFSEVIEKLEEAVAQLSIKEQLDYEPKIFYLTYALDQEVAKQRLLQYESKIEGSLPFLGDEENFKQQVVYAKCLYKINPDVSISKIEALEKRAMKIQNPRDRCMLLLQVLDYRISTEENIPAAKSIKSKIEAGIEYISTYDSGKKQCEIQLKQILYKYNHLLCE